MSKDLFDRGGPYNIKKIDRDQYSFEITIPPDEHGRIARECTEESCSPGYFKVKCGTGITENHIEAFCPYCRASDEPDAFKTTEQVRYCKDIMLREASIGMNRMMKEALGLDRSGKRKIGGGFLSIDMSMKQKRASSVRRLFEEELLRMLICPYCSLDHGVFGLAIWYPDCGADVFLEHVRLEYNVVRSMLSDVERRRTDLGPRVAARDIENCLEDIVSIFEAVLKAMLVRHLRTTGEQEEDIHQLLKNRIRNGLQNPIRAKEIIQKRMNQDLFAELSQGAVDRLCATFEKRHLITHNLGVIDRKYLDNAYAAEREGREISITTAEIEEAIALCTQIVEALHQRSFLNQMQ